MLRKPRFGVGIATVAAVGALGAPIALGGGTVPKSGDYTGFSQIVGQAPVVGGYSYGFNVKAGRPRKAHNFQTDMRRCDGALTRGVIPDDVAPINGDGEFKLKETTQYADGFITVTFEGNFNSETRGGGVIKINAKYKGTPCKYTMKLGRLGPGTGKTPK